MDKGSVKTISYGGHAAYSASTKDKISFERAKHARYHVELKEL